MDLETINRFKDFVRESKKNTFAIYFSENYQLYSAGLALIIDKRYEWVENIEKISTLEEQYGFDSQGYGEAICIADINDDINLNSLQLIAEDNQIHYRLPTSFFTKSTAIKFLESFESDTDLILFTEKSFKDFVFETVAITTIHQ